LSPLTPIIVESTTDLLGEIMRNSSSSDGSFDLPWDVAAGNRLSMQISLNEPVIDEDEEFSLVSLYFRYLLSFVDARSRYIEHL